MVMNKKCNSYTCGFQSDDAKNTSRARKAIYKSVPDPIKAEKECKDVPVSNFKQWVTMKTKGKYNYNLSAKKLRASAFPKTEEIFIKYVRERERLFEKDKIGLNWAFMQAKAMEFNESVDGEDGFKA